MFALTSSAWRRQHAPEFTDECPADENRNTWKQVLITNDRMNHSSVCNLLKGYLDSVSVRSEIVIQRGKRSVKSLTGLF